MNQEQLNYWNGYANINDEDFTNFKDVARHFGITMHKFQTESVRSTGDLAFTEEEVEEVMDSIIEFYKANGNKINPGVIEALMMQF